MTVRILIGDCRLRLAELPDASVDSVVCDPPYELGFMGKAWDATGVANDPSMWREVRRVLKPGGHLVAFSGTRTYHRMAVAIEDAGFEIRDQLAWVYGSGFPKSLDVSKQIDKAAGAEREVVGDSGTGRKSQTGRDGAHTMRLWGNPDGAAPITAPATDAAREWQGWGTALKPSWEPICLARKPLIGTVCANVLAHGTGALNIDGCRIEGESTIRKRTDNDFGIVNDDGWTPKAGTNGSDLGRWPANLCHDGSEEVLAGLPDTSSGYTDGRKNGIGSVALGQFAGGTFAESYGDSGSAARFFYCAKATTDERGEGNNHPTVKPVALMRWLCRLVTPKGGTVLDPFMGSGSTLLAAEAEQFNAIGCEMSPEYAAIAERRLNDASGMFANVSVCLGRAA